MGNVETDANGVAKGSFQDKLIKLIGPQSVLGVSYLDSSRVKWGGGGYLGGWNYGCLLKLGMVRWMGWDG